MRTGLIVFGVIFLVIGILLYVVPAQVFGAKTTTTENGNTNTSTASAYFNIPIQWAYAFGAIGILLLIFGFAIPASNITKEDSYESLKTRDIETADDGTKHKIIKEHTERHVRN